MKIDTALSFGFRPQKKAANYKVYCLSISFNFN
ncbi:MAG: hypothetical protein ACI97N_001554, partial [Cognaticolwellia sp.]